MEYTNIAADYTGLICKKIDVIDPENDNIIQMQKIKNENENNNSQQFKIISIIFSVLIGIIIAIYIYNNWKTIDSYNTFALSIFVLLCFIIFIVLLIVL